MTEQQAKEILVEMRDSESINARKNLASVLNTAIKVLEGESIPPANVLNTIAMLTIIRVLCQKTFPDDRKKDIEEAMNVVILKIVDAIGIGPQGG